MKFIITAGGQGTKVWPYSRKDNPKQFQKLMGEQSLFTYNIDILLREYSPKDIYVSTKKQYVKLAVDQAPKIPLSNYIVEPNTPKNRGPAEGFAFLKLSMLHPNEPFFLVQPDCVRLPIDQYLKTIKTCEKFVKKDKKFITGGIKPDYPVLGVDYLLLGNSITTDSELVINKVKKFAGRFKTFDETKDFVEKNNTTIHCNHACWYPNMMLEAYKQHRPDWYEALMRIKKVLGTADEEAKIEEIYNQMESGATELVTQHIFSDGYCFTLPFTWTDIGTWNSIYEYFTQNSKNDSYKEGNVITVDSSGNFVKSQNSDKLIAVMGLKDMVVVDTEDILLIVPRDKAGQISDIHKKLKEDKLEKYL